MKKAYWNYQLIAYDGSGGMHNPKYAIDVLTKSILLSVVVVPVQMTSFTAEVSGNQLHLTGKLLQKPTTRDLKLKEKQDHPLKVLLH
jgi:hypothetical protein